MIRHSLHAVANEAYKALLHLASYKFNTIAHMIQRSIGFLAIGFVLGQGQIDPRQMAFVLPGWIMSFYARIILFQIDQGVTEEAHTGTLEQMYMSPVPSGVLLLGRVCAVLVVATLMVSATATGLALLVGIRLPLRWEALPVIAITLLGLFGFSFFVGGAALVFKNVHALADLTQDLLLFVNGTFVAVALMPLWLRTLGLALPTTYGIALIRTVVIDGRSLGALLADGSLPLLVAHSAAYFIGGWLVYVWCERIARREGTLGQY
jgi:ABC-2 type transport system permease protein